MRFPPDQRPPIHPLPAAVASLCLFAISGILAGCLILGIIHLIKELLS